MILQAEREEVKNFWSPGTLGISAKEEFSDDTKAVDKFMETIKRDEAGMYSVWFRIRTFEGNNKATEEKWKLAPDVQGYFSRAVEKWNN